MTSIVEHLHYYFDGLWNFLSYCQLFLKLLFKCIHRTTVPSFLILGWPRMGRQVIKVMSLPGLWGPMDMLLQNIWPRVIFICIISSFLSIHFPQLFFSSLAFFIDRSTKSPCHVLLLCTRHAWVLKLLLMNLCCSDNWFIFFYPIGRSSYYQE